MDQNLRSLQLLGMAKKAGLLAVGGDAVSAAARSGKLRLIISASDASERSLRRALQSSKTAGAEHVGVPYTKFDIGNMTGRGSPGTVAIADTGLAAGFLKGLAATDPETYSEAAQRLEKLVENKSSKRRAGL